MADAVAATIEAEANRRAAEVSPGEHESDEDGAPSGEDGDETEYMSPDEDEDLDSEAHEASRDEL